MSKLSQDTSGGMHSQDLLGLLMALGLAVALAVLLVGLGSLVGSSGGDELVAELRLVGLGVLVLWGREQRRTSALTGIRTSL